MIDEAIDRPSSTITLITPDHRSLLNLMTSVGGAIVIFTKAPIAGASKTRLSPLLGDDGAASLARAMLSDIVVALSECVS
jgi:hypothetical protein